MPKIRLTDDLMDGAREPDQRISRHKKRPDGMGWGSAAIFQCTGKMAYTQELAKRRARKIDTWVSYKCANCKFWHVGNRSHRNDRS